MNPALFSQRLEDASYDTECEPCQKLESFVMEPHTHTYPTTREAEGGDLLGGEEAASWLRPQTNKGSRWMDGSLRV